MTIHDLQTQLNEKLASLQGNVALSAKFLKTNETLEINHTKEFWAASVIKIPIACEFFRQVEENKLNENTRTKVARENSVDGTGILKLLDTQDELTYLDLVKLMLTISDNTATNQVVDIIGWENVEKYMHQIGLTNTTFKHKMMIKAGRGPNLTTSNDMAALLEKLYTKQLAGSEKLIGILKHQYDRTRIPLYLPNEIEIAHKPGSLPEAMHDAGIIYSANPFIFVFLSDDQKDKRQTNEVLAQSAKLCFDYSVAQL